MLQRLKCRMCRSFKTWRRRSFYCPNWGSHNLWSTVTFLFWKHSRRLQKSARL